MSENPNDYGADAVIGLLTVSDVQLRPQSPLVLLKLEVLAGIVGKLIEANAQYVVVGVAKSDTIGDGHPLVCLLKSDAGAHLDGVLYAAQGRNTADLLPKPPPLNGVVPS